MIQNLSIVLSFTCFVFILFSKGCEGQTCSDSELKKCAPTYHIHKLGLSVCSGLSSNVTCVQHIVKDCETKLDVPENRKVHNSGLEQLNLYNIMGCVQQNRGVETMSSLMILAVVSVSAFIMQ